MVQVESPALASVPKYLTVQWVFCVGSCVLGWFVHLFTAEVSASARTSVAPLPPSISPVAKV